MRKVIAIAMVAMMIFAITTSVYATEKELSGSSQVLAKVDNLFSVKIPAEIDLRNGADTSAVTINNARVASDKTINVYCMNCVDHGIVLTNTANENKTIECEITNLELNKEITEDIPICSFDADDIVNKTASKEFGIDVTTLGTSSNAGEYIGLLMYGFAIE